MAYQIKYCGGYEIYVVGDACRVINSNNQEEFAGTYEECAAWLADRRVKQHCHRQTAADIAETGRGNR
jgi:hypothetical protein